MEGKGHVIEGVPAPSTYGPGHEKSWGIRVGDAWKIASEEFEDPVGIQAVVTSPPYYGLRSYGDDEREVGAEDTLEDYINGLVSLFHALAKHMTADATVWLNVGDSYVSKKKGAGSTTGSTLASPMTAAHFPEAREVDYGDSPEHSLARIPHKIAEAMEKSEDRWVHRNDIIWYCPNRTPTSAMTHYANTYEHVLVFSKEKIKFIPMSKPGATRYVQKWSNSVGGASSNVHVVDCMPRMRDVWQIPKADRGLGGRHGATFPEELPRRCVLSSTVEGDLVVDPFCGSGTTLAVAVKHGRRAAGFELYPEYAVHAARRVDAAYTEKKAVGGGLARWMKA